MTTITKITPYNFPYKTGDGATIQHWSDRTPTTIVRMSPSKKTIWIQEDSWLRTDSNGMSEMQSYNYERDTKGAVHAARFTKKGWKCCCGRVYFGERNRYHDFSF